MGMGRAIWWALCIIVLAAIGVAVFRPATFFGVSGKALANSLGGEVRHAEATCTGNGSGRWRCALAGEDYAGVEYDLESHSYGCWSASLVSEPSHIGETLAPTLSGCIGLTDEFGI